VLRRHDTDRFCTALLVRLRREGTTWRATVCAAGHPLPVLVPADGEPRLVGTPGSLLGVLPAVDVPAAEVELGPQDRLLLYTDGVTEGRRAGEEYGEERLLARAGKAEPGAAGLVEAVLNEVLAFQSGVPRDDIALLAVTPAPVAENPEGGTAPAH
jgi:phosphoserine phosphatase RsbU/P